MQQGQTLLKPKGPGSVCWKRLYSCSRQRRVKNIWLKIYHTLLPTKPFLSSSLLLPTFAISYKKISPHQTPNLSWEIGVRKVLLFSFLPHLNHPWIFGSSYRKQRKEGLPQQWVPTPPILSKLILHPLPTIFFLFFF